VKWLKWRTHRRPDPPSAEQREASRAVAREDRKFREITAETSGILEEVERLKRLGSQNDFAAKIRQAMGGAS
jgi:hypothetical protein